MLPRRTSNLPTGLRSAFTLIELLIVVGIIGLLLSIGMLVGKKVISGGRERLTQDIIRVLDSSVEAYQAARNEMPPSRLAYRDKDGKIQHECLVFDGRKDGSGFDRDADAPAYSSVAVYTAAIASVTQAQAVIAAINPKQVRQVEVAKDITVDGKKFTVTGQEVLDGWNRPIRAVSPGFDGGAGAYFDGASMKPRTPFSVTYVDHGTTTTDVFRRSYRPFNPKSATGQPIGDADEGLCPSRRIYFYSAGSDNDPGTREDNVYSTVPQFPKETAALN